MVKKYIDAGYVLREIEKEELYEHEKKYKDIMEEVPNFKHDKFTCDKRVYENNHYVILKVKSKGRVGYIVHNTKKPFASGHTHLQSLDMAKIIINNVIHKKKPKTSNIYLLESHIRLSDDIKYVNDIKHLIEIKKCKKGEYVNRTSDKKR
ncbi:MAG: hypothetical protein ACRDD7_08820 [Peptostreptococcaceae bacterium]